MFLGPSFQRGVREGEANELKNHVAYSKDSCHNVPRTLLNKRHDNVKNLVHMWAKHAGCAAVKEPQNKAGTQERADNWINDPHGNAYLCDVAIVQPACPTHVSKSQQRLGAANHAALEKHTQYDAMANAEGEGGLKCAAEVYGVLDQDFVTFIKRMGYFAGEDDGCPWSQHEVVSQMYGSIAVGGDSEVDETAEGDAG
jgi:hypothetical protein